MNPRGGALLDRRYAAGTVSILALVTVIAFETLAVSTTMPQVATELGMGGAYGLAFSLMFTGQLLGIALAGALAARLGPVVTLWAGAALFAAGSLVAGLAGAFTVLLAGRLLAGVGAGLALVAIYVVIGAAYPLALRPTVFAWVASAWVLPSIVGPLIAAALTQALGWRSVFLLIVPLTAAGSAGVGRAGRLLATGPGPQYREDLGAEPTPPPSLRRVTGYGVALAAGAAAFQAGTSLVDGPRGALVALTVLGLGLIGWAAPALLPAGTLRMRRGQPSVMVSRFLLMASFNGTVAFAPLMLVEHVGLGLMTTGALLTLASLGWTIGSFAQSRPSQAGRGPQLIHHGTVLLVVATGGFLVGDALAWPPAVLGFWLLLVGLAMGLAVTATSVLALELAPRGGHAAASSSLQVADVLGSVIGIAVAGAAYASWRALAVDPTVLFLVVWAVTTTLAAVGLPAAARTAAPVISAAAGDQLGPRSASRHAADRP